MKLHTHENGEHRQNGENGQNGQNGEIDSDDNYTEVRCNFVDIHKRLKPKTVRFKSNVGVCVLCVGHHVSAAGGEWL